MMMTDDLHITSAGQLAYGIFLVEIVQELYIVGIYVERVPKVRVLESHQLVSPRKLLTCIRRSLAIVYP
jgi:hypothetical protein